MSAPLIVVTAGGGDTGGDDPNLTEEATMTDPAGLGPEQLAELIRAASTPEQLDELRWQVVHSEHCGQLHDVAALYAQRRRELEAEQRAAELAAAAIEERLLRDALKPAFVRAALG